MNALLGKNNRNPDHIYFRKILEETQTIYRKTSQVKSYEVLAGGSRFPVCSNLFERAGKVEPQKKPSRPKAATRY